MSEPFLILHLSDLHFGPHSRFDGQDMKPMAERFHQAMEEARKELGIAERIGLVVVTGDGLDHRFGHFKPHCAPRHRDSKGLPRIRHVDPKKVAETVVKAAHLTLDEMHREARLLQLAARRALRGASEQEAEAVLQYEQSAGLDPLWPALARHVAGLGSTADRTLLEELARHPEQRKPPLSYALQFYVRGDLMWLDGRIETLDALCDELQLPHLPLLEESPIPHDQEPPRSPVTP